MQRDRSGAWMRVSEVAARMGYSHSTALSLDKAGVVPGGVQRRERGMWLVHRETFDAYEASTEPEFAKSA